MTHKTVSQDEWLKARQNLLVKEKELTRQKDKLTQARMELPWVKVEKDYQFETNDGVKSFSELFGKNSQLFVYHFMFAPDWEEGCSGCSFVSDHVDAARQHFENHDVSYVAASTAPLEKLNAFKKRMGWKFEWVSSGNSDFNHDFNVTFKREELDKGDVLYNFTLQKIKSEELPGLSAFYKDEEGNIFHTYSTYDRGLDILLGAYNFLELAPKGRNESSPMEWMKYHDQY